MKINSIDSSNERLVDNGKDFFRSKIDDIGNKNTVGGKRKIFSRNLGNGSSHESGRWRRFSIGSS